MNASPAGTTLPEADTTAAAHREARENSGYSHEWAMRVGATAAILVVGAAAMSSCGGGGTNTEASPSPVTATETVTAEPPAVTATATVTAEPTPKPKPKPKPKKPQVGGRAGSGAGDTFVMPDERGKALQAAQDDLQAVSGNPFFFSDSKDATGSGRAQVFDSGWQVCTQNRAPGSKVSVDDMGIVFGVVRVSEQCP